jgi:hypothetical protein
LASLSEVEKDWVYMWLSCDGDGRLASGKPQCIELTDRSVG